MFVKNESNILFDAFKTSMVASLFFLCLGLCIFILVWGKKLKGFSHSLICPGSKLKISLFFCFQIMLILISEILYKVPNTAIALFHLS